MTADYLTDRFAEYMAALPVQQSFFATLGLYEPHRPYIASVELRKACQKEGECKDLSNRWTSQDKLVNYYGTVIAIDRALGRVQKILDEHGRTDDTLLLFFSDNGPESIEKDGAGSSGIFRGSKRDLYEGGHRVPGILHWPERIKKNHIITELTSTLDIFLTMQSLFIQAFPNTAFENVFSDGVSLVPLIDNPVNWKRNVGFGICHAVDFETFKYCSEFAYIKRNKKVIGSRTAPYRFKVFDLDVDIREQNPLPMADLDNDWKLFLAEAVDWVKDLLVHRRKNCT